MVFIVTILTSYPLILKSQPRSHSQWSSACEGQTPANKIEMLQVVNLHNTVLTTVTLYVLSLPAIWLSLLHRWHMEEAMSRYSEYWVPFTVTNENVSPVIYWKNLRGRNLLKADKDHDFKIQSLHWKAPRQQCLVFIADYALKVQSINATRNRQIKKKKDIYYSYCCKRLPV